MSSAPIIQDNDLEVVYERQITHPTEIENITRAQEDDYSWMNHLGRKKARYDPPKMTFRSGHNLQCIPSRRNPILRDTPASSGNKRSHTSLQDRTAVPSSDVARTSATSNTSFAASVVDMDICNSDDSDNEDYARLVTLDQSATPAKTANISAGNNELHETVSTVKSLAKENGTNSPQLLIAFIYVDQLVEQFIVKYFYNAKLVEALRGNKALREKNEEVLRSLQQRNDEVKQILENQKNHGQLLQTTRAERDQMIRVRDKTLWDQAQRLAQAEVRARQVEKELADYKRNELEIAELWNDGNRRLEQTEAAKLSMETELNKANTMIARLKQQLVAEQKLHTGPSSKVYGIYEKKLMNTHSQLEKEKETNARLKENIRKVENKNKALREKTSKDEKLNERLNRCVCELRERSIQVVGKCKEFDAAIEKVKCKCNSCYKPIFY